MLKEMKYNRFLIKIGGKGDKKRHTIIQIK